jgi:hypothetical protein
VRFGVVFKRAPPKCLVFGVHYSCQVTTQLTMDLPYLRFFNLKEEPCSAVSSPREVFLASVHTASLEKTAYVVGAKKRQAALPSTPSRHKF